MLILKFIPFKRNIWHNISIMKTKYLITILTVLCYCFTPICHAALNDDQTVLSDDDNGIKEAVELIDLSMYKEAEKILLDRINKDIAGREKSLFLLGRLYKEKGDFERAEEYMKKAAAEYDLLRDYAYKLLTGIYLDSGKFEKAIITLKQIKNAQLIQYTRKMEIKALIALKRESELIEVLSRYVKDYKKEREDWDYKLSLARLLKKRGDDKKAVNHFKDIYINAAHVADDAYEELKHYHANSLTTGETLKRSGNLYSKHNYRAAETSYKKVLPEVPQKEKSAILYKIAMSQFRQKKYTDSSGSFGLLGGPKSMYYRARSFYRINDEDGFMKAKSDFEKKYPGNKHLALVFLMEAEEFRRQGRLQEAEKSYKRVLTDFKTNAEDALWGLGWMYYVSAEYKSAMETFSKLTSFVKNRDYYKYLYWKARAREKLSVNCIMPDSGHKKSDECKDNENYFRGLPSDKSYYGYLIKNRFLSHSQPVKMEVEIPRKPEDEKIDKIEALALLGMREEALNELVVLLKQKRKMNEILYLVYMAMDLGEYKHVIAFAEQKQDSMYLPYSYPRGYWKIITKAADTEQLDAHLIAALIREESRFDPKAFSWAGAFGLMQLLPSTAKRLKTEIGITIEENHDIFDAEKNIMLGSHYLSKLIEEFREVPFAIAAYNAGERRLEKWITRFDKGDIAEFIENIPYKETRRYVKKVLKSYWQYRTINGLPIRGIEKKGMKLTQN